MRPPPRWVLVLLAAAALLHASRYTSHYTDAGLLALRRSTDLLSTWTIGDSGLLWVVALALLDGGGVPGVDGARFLGALGLVLSIAVVAREHPLPAAWIVLSGAAASASMGGLPLTVLAATAAAAAVRLREGRGWWLGVLLSLLRLDGFVLVVGLGLGAGRRGTRFLAAGAIAFASHLALAAYSFQSPLPTPGSLVEGGGGLLMGALWQLPLLAVVAFAVRRQPRASPEVGGVLAWGIWALFAGLGTRGGFAAWVPVLPLLVLLTEGLPWKTHLLALGMLPSLFSPIITQRVDEDGPLATRPVARALLRGFGERVPTLASAQPGALPYFTGFPATTLEQAEGAELVALCDGLGALEPCTEAGQRWVASPDWSAYRPMRVEADGRTGTYWLRVDGRFGPQRYGEGIEVPALMLSSEQHPAKAGRDGFYLDLAKGDTVVLQLDLPRGRWRLATQGFRGPELLHNGGPLKLTAIAVTDRVASSITWIAEPR